MVELLTAIAGIPYLPEVVNLLLAVHGLALFIVNVTPTDKDNEAVATVYRWIEILAGIINSNKVKQ